LQPLYGKTDDDINRLRKHQKGMIKQDSFADERMASQFPGVAALLVLFSRNHNWIAHHLLEKNEDNRFDPTKYSEEYLDEKVFQTARLVNCGCYMNLIVHDYITAILGLPFDSKFHLDPTTEPPSHNPIYGNQVSLGCTYLYRWHSTIGQDDARRLPALTPLSSSNCEAELVLDRLQRVEGGTFTDKELAHELRKAMKQVAGHPGAFHIPVSLRESEVTIIQQARAELQICTLNEYRATIGLKKHTSFEEINSNPRVTKALKTLYASPADVELYPGLVVEQTQESCYGLAFGHSTSVSILRDVVNLVRNDRFYTTQYTPKHLTEFGYNLVKNPACVGVPAHNGSIIAHLFSHLNGQFHPNEPVVKDPFHVLISTHTH
jgi:hypothetical protein